MVRLEKIVSGGQTGADRAALDVAIELGIPHGGWIPKGRKTERGPLPAKYKLKEVLTADCPKRTERNVIDSDGTLIISHGGLSGGSDFTRKMAEKHGKPWIHLDANNFSLVAAVEIFHSGISFQFKLTFSRKADYPLPLRNRPLLTPFFFEDQVW
jgi:hypothetical protein